jgi:hypothetical protein
MRDEDLTNEERETQ